MKILWLKNENFKILGKTYVKYFKVKLITRKNQIQLEKKQKEDILCCKRYTIYAAKIYIQATSLLKQKGCTLNFIMIISCILDYDVTPHCKSHIFCN